MSFDKEFFLKLAQLIWGTTLVRLGGTIAIIGAIALTSIVQYLAIAIANELGYSLPIPETPGWIGVFLVVFGVATAALGTYVPKPKLAPNPYDIDLLQAFRAVFLDDELQFLKEHTFANSFILSRLNGTRTLGGWSGPRYEFQNEVVQTAFSDVITEAQEFSLAIAQHTGPTNGNAALATVFDSTYNGWNIPEHTQIAINELDSKAGSLANSIEAFERIASKEILT